MSNINEEENVAAADTDLISKWPASATGPNDLELTTVASIRAGYNATKDAKLDGIEDNATADQTGFEIKTAYELQADTNAYTDEEKAKVAALNNRTESAGDASLVEFPNNNDGGFHYNSTSGMVQLAHNYNGIVVHVDVGGIYDVDAQGYFDRVKTEDGTVLTVIEKAEVELAIVALKTAGLWDKFSTFHYYDFSRNTNTGANLLPITAGSGNFVLSANAVTSGVRNAYGIALPGINSEYASGPVLAPETGSYAYFVRYKFATNGGGHEIINFSNPAADAFNNQLELQTVIDKPHAYQFTGNVAQSGVVTADGADITFGACYNDETGKDELRVASGGSRAYDAHLLSQDNQHNHDYTGGETFLGGEKSTNLHELEIQSLIVVGFGAADEMTDEDFHDLRDILNSSLDIPSALMTPAEAVTDFVDRMLSDVSIVVPAEGQTLALEIFTELAAQYETPGDDSTASMMSRVKNMPALSTLFGVPATGTSRQTVDLLGEGRIYDIPDGAVITKNGWVGREGQTDAIYPTDGKGICAPGNSVVAIGEGEGTTMLWYQDGAVSNRRFFCSGNNAWQNNSDRLAKEHVYVVIAPKEDEFGAETTNNDPNGFRFWNTASSTWIEASTVSNGTGLELSIDPHKPTYIGGNDASGTVTKRSRVRDFLVLSDWTWDDTHLQFFGGKLTDGNVIAEPNWNIATKTKWIHPVLILGDSLHDNEQTDWASMMMRSVFDREEGLVWWNTAAPGSRLEQMFVTPPQVSTNYLFENIATKLRDVGFDQTGVVPIIINLHAHNDFAGQTGTLQDEYDLFIRYQNNMKDIALTGSTTIVDDGSRVVNIGAPLNANTLFIQGSGQPDQVTSLIGGVGVSAQSDLWDGSEDFDADPSAALAASDANNTEARQAKANRKIVAEPEGWWEGVIDIFDELIQGDGHPVGKGYLHFSLDDAHTSDSPPYDNVHLLDASNATVAAAAATQLRTILDGL